VNEPPGAVIMRENQFCVIPETDAEPGEALGRVNLAGGSPR